MQADPRIPLDEASAGLLAKLAQDAELRTAIERDPVATLAKLGFEIDPADVPETVVLPEADEIRWVASSETDPETFWNPFILGD